jgi:hypothetical protein
MTWIILNRDFIIIEYDNIVLKNKRKEFLLFYLFIRSNLLFN